MSDDTQVVTQDEEDEKKAAGPQPEPKPKPADRPVDQGVMPAPTPSVSAVAAQAPPVAAPAINAPAPGPVPDTGGSVAAGPQNKGYAAIDKLSAIQQQNPFNLLMAREENIHNPFLRVMAKAATGIGRGAETLAPDYPQIQSERMAAAAAPGEAAARTAQTNETTARTAAIPAETAKTQAETAALQNPKPKLLPGEENTATGQDGTKYNAYEMPNGSVQWFPEGQPPQTGVAPTGGQAGGSAAPSPVAGPAGPQTATAGPQPTAGANGGLPAGATVGKAQQVSPEVAAKLKPVGEDAAAYNKQIADVAGGKAADFQVKPTDSKEDAEKKLADARAQSESDRGKAAEGRGAAAESRANETEDIKPVQATESDGRTVITNFGDARKRGLTDILPVSSTEITNARSTLTNVNLMEQALKNMKENVSDFDALTTQDKGYLNKILNSPVMVPSGGALGYVSGTISGSIESQLQSAEYNNMSEPAKNILRNVVNLRESSLGLGKLETGGSRAMQSAIDAINSTIPGRNITNAKDAETQLRMFADRLDEIKTDAPVIKGHAFRDNPFKEAAPDKEPSRPSNVPSGYKWNAKGPQGAGWYK